MERPWTEITGEAKEELFRLCRCLLLKKCDKTSDDLRHVLKQWYTFRDGKDGTDKKNVESMCETNESVTLDDISRFFNLLDAAISVCQRHSLTDYSFGKGAALLHENVIPNLLANMTINVLAKYIGSLTLL